MLGFLTILAGAKPDVLEKCPTERIRFQSLGSAILITSLIATVSMWFALSSALGVNPFLALPIALMWGLIILGIDRWLVTSIPLDSPRRWAIALPRLFLALLLGSLISTPLVLRIFQSEINSQIAVIKQQRASAFLAVQLNSQVGKQVRYWTKDVANLQQVIDSGGSVPINPSNDSEIKSLTKQRTAELVLEQQYYVQWQCQLYGGKGCTVKGNGPLAQATEKSYRQAANVVATLTSAIQRRDAQLSATDSASKRARLHQAQAALPGAQQQLATAVEREDKLQQNFDSQNESVNGLLIRLEALGQLSSNSFTLNAARVLLFLLFLVIEFLPVTVKLMQRPGNYEAILKDLAAKELNDARRYYRNQPPSSVPGESGNDSPDPRDIDLQEIWRPTKVMPSWASTGADQPFMTESDETEEHTRLDDVALRDLDDFRVTADSDRYGGIELRYGDDEL